MHHRSVVPIALSAAFASFGLSAPSADRLNVRQLSGSLAVVGGQEPLTFRYTTPDAYSTNWVGLYYPGGGPINQVKPEQSLVWAYAPDSEGTVKLSPSGLQPGHYSAYFLARDGYKWLAEPITAVLPRAPSGPLSFLVNKATLHNARRGEAYEARVGGFVAGGSEALTFSQASSDSWAKVSPEGTITGTPGRTASNTYITLRATSGDSSAEIKLTIPVRRAGSSLVKTLRVLTFNMWHGGTQVDNYHEKQVRFLLESNVDIVGLQEDQSGRHAHRLANALGWHYWASSRSVGVISRYPIAEKFGEINASGGVRIALDGDEQQINFWVVHLGYTPYGPYDFCFDGMDVETVIEREVKSGRTPQITDTLAAMKGQIASAGDVPVLLVGDFNAPSHLDWTEALRKKNCGFANVLWPTSVKTTDAGLVDSFRVANPDPVKVPGITWSPLFPFHDGATGRSEPQDRIDFIYHAGNLTVKNSKDVVVGNPKPSPNHKQNEWTTDHATILTTYELPA
ncbi:hypothetical protein VDGD_05006 [Verticillium dahliae]|nr:hypothetical protein VDGD_05006 [Verticillium dahliae]